MAFGIPDLVALMDRWGVWKEVRANADKVPTLGRRIGARPAPDVLNAARLNLEQKKFRPPKDPSAQLAP
jgi:hypothetical protein